MQNPVFCAFDIPAAEAFPLADKLQGMIGGIKVGQRFLSHHGHEGIKKLHGMGFKTFVDLKFKDTPERVAEEAEALTACAPSFISVHADGGAEMMQRTAARVAEEAERRNVKKPQLLAVTVLSSMDQNDLVALGLSRGVGEQTQALADLAQKCGMDGIIASGQDVEMLRQQCGEDFLIIATGLRGGDDDKHDHKRTVSGQQAYAMGANYLVIGRALTQAVDPQMTAATILRDVQV